MDKTFKVIVAGGRYFDNYELLKTKLDFLLQNKRKEYEIEIVSGCARGADTLAIQYANEQSFKIAKFPADWNKYGKSAGYKRNVQMAEYADALVAFWDGYSRGTKNMIKIAKEKGLNIRIVRYESW